jgi:hypothetical protein
LIIPSQFPGSTYYFILYVLTEATYTESVVTACNAIKRRGGGPAESSTSPNLFPLRESDEDVLEPTDVLYGKLQSATSEKEFCDMLEEIIRDTKTPSPSCPFCSTVFKNNKTRNRHVR